MDIFEKSVMVKEATSIPRIRITPQIRLNILKIFGICVLIYVAAILLTLKFVTNTDFSKLGELGIQGVMQELNSNKFGLLINLFLNIIFIVMAILFCTQIEKRSVASMGFRSTIASHYILGYIAGVLMISASVWAVYFLNALRSQPVTDRSILFIILFCFGFVVQGMSEEVITHGLLMMSLMNRIKPIIALLVSSILFAMFHLGNPGVGVIPIINLFLFGTFEGLLIIKTDNIWGAAAMHAAWNFFQGNIYGIQVSGTQMTSSVMSFTQTENMQLLNGGDFGIEGSIIVTAVLVVSLILLYLIPMKNRTETA